MRKWRPGFCSLYVIPEIHGNIHSLETILNRILPLRVHKGQEDRVVFLGDYIDGFGQSAEVIECLLKVKAEYPDRAFFIRGNHEELFNKALKNENDFDYWTNNGGLTTISSYIEFGGNKLNPSEIKTNRLADVIPKDHLDFLSNLDYYLIIDNYCFFHSGFDHNKTILENNIINFCFDDTSIKYVKKTLMNNEELSFKDDYIFVSAHNCFNKPAVHSKYFMLGGFAPKRLMVFDLNSMTACASKHNKTRIYPYEFITLE